MLRVVTLPSVPSCLPSVGHGLWGVFPVLVVVGMVMMALLSRVLIVALLLMMMRMII
jgi:hypothetical protein